MALDAVIFDWGGTLTPWHTIDAGQAWSAFTADPAQARRLREIEDSLWIRSRDEHRSATMREVFRLAEHAPDVDGQRAFDEWWDPHTHTDPAAEGLFQALHERGVRVGVLSNTLWSRERHERIFARDGVLDLIDGAVYTSEIPWTKPHPDAFRAALDAVDVTDPARAVFVGDRLFDDIWGARALGIRAVLVPHSEIPDTQLGHSVGEPDAVIEKLPDLLEHVDRWR